MDYDYDDTDRLLDRALDGRHVSSKSANKFRVNSNKFRDYIKNSKMTPQGGDWLVNALDSFHDSDIDNPGMPDGNIAKSIVLKVPQILTISSPVSSGSWDCSIVDFPTITSGPKIGFVQCQSISVSPNGPNGEIQYNLAAFAPAPVGLSAITTPSGGDLDWTAQASAYLTTPTLTLPSTYGQSVYRIIGKGFEVINTTKIVDKSGSVILWTQSVPDMRTASTYLYNDSGAAHTGNLCGVLTSAPPKNAAAAELLTNSVLLEASGGCYVNGRMNSVDIPPSTCTPSCYIYYKDTPNSNAYVAPQPFQVAAFNYAPSCNQQYFNLTGAYFTGLSSTTVLTVRYVLTLEVFPTYGDALLSTARLSPSYDPIALAAYGKFLQKMPVGCPARDNFLGEWFNKIVSQVRKPFDAVGDIASKIPIVRNLIKLPKAINSGLDNISNRVVENIEKGEVNKVAQELAAITPQGRLARVIQGKAMSTNRRGASNQRRRR